MSKLKQIVQAILSEPPLLVALIAWLVMYFIIFFAVVLLNMDYLPSAIVSMDFLSLLGLLLADGIVLLLGYAIAKSILLAYEE